MLCVARAGSEARADAALIKGLMRRTAEDVITIGQALIRQKEALPHGSFLPWIAAEFAMTDRTARRFMSVADVYGSKSDTVSDLSLNAVYELASATTDVQADVERRIAAGEIIGAADVKKLKQRAQEIVQQNAALADANRDLIANAHQTAQTEAEKKYKARITELEQRVAMGHAG